MASILSFLLDGSGLPHGYCIAWDPRLLWVMVFSNGVVALAYFSIPFALARFLWLQKSLPFSWMFVLFSAFIFSCGLTHVIDIVNIYRPAYRLDAVMMSITAVLSLATAATLIPLVPRASQYISHDQEREADLQRLNQALQDSTAELALRNSALASSEQRFRLTLQGAPIGLAIVGLDGRWIEVNEALCKSLEYSAAELLQKTFQQITHPEDLDHDLQHVQRLLQGLDDSYRMEKRYFTKSGRILKVQLDVTLLRDQHGQPVHFISQIQDITARKQIEEALRLSAAEAQTFSELDGMLQACQSLTEIGPPAARACVALYPDSSGVIYLRNASKNNLERLHGWGDETISEAVFAPEDCWALRRGAAVSVQLHAANATLCKHLGSKHADATSLCLPMQAQGETVGMLCLQWPRTSLARDERPAQQIGNRLGLAIANLQLRETLRYQSIVDPLTGLYNRRHLEESLARDLARAEREDSTVAVLMIDVDHFKRYNDRYGHALGDQVLQQVGSTLLDFCRRGDLAARYGGEEFTVVMSGIDEVTAIARAEKLRARMVDTRLMQAGREIPAVTISVGVAMYPAHGNTQAVLIDAADQALYAAKRRGRNRVVSRSEPLSAS